MVQDTHPTYDIFQLFFETADTGHAGAARDRTYLLMSHHDKTSCKFDPMTMKDIISKRMRQKVQTRPSDYFMATWMEVENEAQQLAAKRKVPYVEDCRDFTYMLTNRELESLQSYERAYREDFGREPSSDPDLVVFLGDNGRSWKTWSARSGSIPTFRRNSKTGLFWSPYLKRFMIAREKLAAMGWPVTEHMARSMCCNVIPSKDVLRAADLAGNAMSFTTVGVAQLLALGCFGPLDP